MPWATPPWICPSTIIGLIRRPASSTTTNRLICTWPVAISTSTTATWQAFEKVTIRVVGRHGRQPGFGDRGKALALVIGGACQLLYLDAEIGAAHEGAAIGNFDIGSGRL